LHFSSAFFHYLHLPLHKIKWNKQNNTDQIKIINLLTTKKLQHFRKQLHFQLQGKWKATGQTGQIPQKA
jgi:hypothetical protein